MLEVLFTQTEPKTVQAEHYEWLVKSFTVPETRVFRAADGEDLVILACTVLTVPLV